MNEFSKLRLLTAGWAALTICSLVPLSAQTTWTNGADGLSWSNPSNWSAGTPSATLDATVGVDPNNSGAPGTIVIDTQETAATNAFAKSLTLGSGLTGSLIFTPAGAFDTLTVDGAITNQSTQSINFELSTTAGAAATYAGGTTGGSLNFQTSLDLQTFNVVMTGAVNISGNLLGTTGTLTVGDGTTASTTTLSSANPAFGGSVVIAANGTLQLGAANGTTGDVGTATSIVDNGTLAIARGDTLTDNGAVISGSGGLNQEGSGTFIITAMDAFTGATTVSAGTLQVNGALSAGSAVTLSSGTTLSGSGTVGGTISATSATISGTGLTLTGLVTVSGSGNTLGGTETSLFGVALSPGSSLTQTDGTLTGSLVDNGVATINGTVTGNVTAGNTTILNGSGTIGGTTTLNGGTINGSGITLTGVATFNGANNSLNGSETALAGVTVGNGSTLTVSGTLTGNLTNKGNTIMDGTVTGNLTSNFGSILQGFGVVNGTTSMASGTVIGSGIDFANGLTFTGTGNSLTGTESGAVSIGAGTSVTQSGTVTGSIDDTSELSTTFSGVIAGVASNVSLNNAAGTLVLKGVNTYGGGTTITTGTLVVGNASALATGDVTQTGGILEAGNSNHTITVGGNYVQGGGGTLVIDLNAEGMNATNDLLNIEGTALLNGTIDVNFGFVPVTGDQFTIVETAGGITGGTAPPVVSPASVNVTDSIVGNDLVLTVLPSQTTPPSTQTILHNFGDGSVTNDGITPSNALTLGTDGNFYGTTATGGSASIGGIFKITPRGQLVSLHSFGDGTVLNDGNHPQGVVQGLDGNFYGIATGGGAASKGIVYKITPQAELTVLHSFGDGTVTNDGSSPQDKLLLASDGNFYGVTSAGGSSNAGTVYKMTPAGVVTILHSFLDGSVTNDGFSPFDRLIQGSDGNFYGMTGLGGSASSGTVFKITPLGQVTILHSFGDGSVAGDGGNAFGILLQGTDGNFYGNTAGGGVAAGSSGFGTIFKITPQGTETILHRFGDGSVPNDGTNPWPLVQGFDGNFYGVAQNGGTNQTLVSGQNYAGEGTLFEITPQGTVTILHDFNDGSILHDGQLPLSTLVQDAGGNFYGVTSNGGITGSGTVFKFVPTLSNLTSPATATGSVAIPFSYQVTGSNTPTVFAATGLPAGLSISATGLITGTPSGPGSFVVTLTLTNAIGPANYQLTITIGTLPAPQIVSILTAYGSVGAAFQYQTVGINDVTGYAATNLTTLNGNPTGLSLDPATGIISGTPTTVGTITASLAATNAIGTSALVNLVINVFAAPPMISQEYNIAHSFNDGTVASDGQGPQSIIQAFDGNYYGATVSGGAFGNGAIFKMTEQGVVSVFFSFDSSSGVFSPTRLIQAASGDFYGTTAAGQIFKLTQAGQLSLLAVLGTTANSLIQGFDGNFYGTTLSGGTAQQGAAFKVTPQGALTILHNFDDGSVPHDGIGPVGVVQGSDGNFYGTTRSGGSGSGLTGTIYKMTPPGAVTILYTFLDNGQPHAGLIQGTDGNFYGVNAGGTSPAAGEAFKITPQGVFTDLHEFNRSREGAFPDVALLQGNDGNFYGTTQQGGSAGLGTIFQMTSQGVVTVLHTFGDGSVADDGSNQAITGPLIQSAAGNFYGVTATGGNSGSGTIFSLIPSQAPTSAPVFTGSAFATSGVFTPFSFTPKATFGVSGPQTLKPSSVQAPASGSLPDPLTPLLSSPSTIQKNFGQTNWKITTGTTTSTMLPNDLMFDSTSGTISGTPIEAGTFTFTMTPENAKGTGTAQTITLYIDVPPGINSGVTETGSIGVPFNYQIVTTPAADSYGATLLPGWLTADPASGLVTGTPPAAGTYVFNAEAANISGQSVQTVTLTVNGATTPFTSARTASTFVGGSFSYHITTSPAAITTTALNLPGGLLFNAQTGTILGTPNVEGTFPIPITATNSSGTFATVLTLTISPPVVPVVASTLETTVVQGAAFSYRIPIVGVADTYAETGALPAGVTLDSATGILSGTPTVTGTFPLGLTLTNVTGNATSALSIVVVPPASFSDWELAHNFTGLPTDIPYHDGVPNLIKYLCDINPSKSVAAADRDALPVIGTTTSGNVTYLTLTYRQYAMETGLTVTVQTSADLANWTTVDTPDLFQQIGTDPTTGDPIIQIGVAMNGTNQHFIRLYVIAP